ncbi:hypothetical protein EB796_021267 [Bugula neritina]|uniref:Uncharacterized protein n=1 Tax=Bugula neritina TaxID=10212 RepID=A0A7J7J4S6_BUGNE|nr:hypothetical protein EB796_021267 [Bugula neritina]
MADYPQNRFTLYGKPKAVGTHYHKQNIRMSEKGDRVAQVVRCHSWLHGFTIFMICGSLIANVVILDYLLDKSNRNEQQLQGFVSQNRQTVENENFSRVKRKGPSQCTCPAGARGSPGPRGPRGSPGPQGSIGHPGAQGRRSSWTTRNSWPTRCSWSNGAERRQRDQGFKGESIIGPQGLPGLPWCSRCARVLQEFQGTRTNGSAGLPGSAGLRGRPGRNGKRTPRRRNSSRNRRRN